ncbi:hypothetical protein CXF68_12995 [Tenacibaculum sp. Bg11-29]|uniref:DUF4114 domain-containing protein n=1 Tax=Tenacibaculum sp. Bg11-29 TaxID=2058306 RepID=UPI000C34F87A|nr:DUF4114 domain-containing protein [Tenacibaculum sp. Bg11-29]PKH51542.1 hypothetical protein CXF68_12995 [Tenacibaculum sp. Bg11-29]
MKKLLFLLVITTATIYAQNYQYLGEYTSNGTPLYLESPGDNISYPTLDMISYSLPESYPVPDYNPHYISSGYETNVVLSETADVWVTFVSEGAGYRNSLGFYTYDINNLPATVPNAEDITIIFPNASALGSGGGLQVGDKVKIGNFPAGTGIGWVLLANAWSYSQVKVLNGYWQLYSNPDYNPEADGNLRHHNVFLNDPTNERLILGFEDIRRDYGNCDNDFNDAVFFVTASSFSALTTSNYADVSSATDVTSAFDGGLESNGKLANLIAQRNFKRKKNGNLFNKKRLQRRYKKKATLLSKGVNPSSIEAFLPATGMYGTEKAFVSTPEDLLGITNAKEIFSVDLYTGEERTSAVLATATKGDVYDHSKEICDRLNNSVLEDVRTVTVRGHQVISSKIKRATGEVEYTLGFSIKLGATANELYSFWNIEQYPGGDYYNFQIWGSSFSQVFTISNHILDTFKSIKPLKSSTLEDVVPSVFVSSGYYKNGNIHLNIINKTKASSLNFEAVLARTEVSDRINMSEVINLTGAWNETIIIPTGQLFDIGLSLSTNTSKQQDALYLADGPWGIDYLEENVRVNSFSIENNDNDKDNGEDIYQIEREPIVSGEIKGTLNLFRHVLAGDQTLDVSGYESIQFKIQNTKPVEVILVQDGIADWENRLRITIPVNDNEKLYTISFNDFLDKNGNPGEITDIKTIVFSLQGDYATYVPFTIAVNDVSFGLKANQFDENLVTTNKILAIPNPINSSGNIYFTADQNEEVTLIIYNYLGQLVYKTNYTTEIGSNLIPVSRENLTSGMYICKIISNNKKYNSLKLLIN